MTSQSEIERVLQEACSISLSHGDQIVIGFDTVRQAGEAFAALRSAFHARAAIDYGTTEVGDGPLREALVGVRCFLMSAPLESGYCCCGSKMEDHNIGSGHSPVDELAYAANREVERIDAALAQTTPPPPSGDIRDQALEEAAKVAEIWQPSHALDDRVSNHVRIESRAIAMTLRSLKSPKGE